MPKGLPICLLNQTHEKGKVFHGEEGVNGLEDKVVDCFGCNHTNAANPHLLGIDRIACAMP